MLTVAVWMSYGLLVSVTLAAGVNDLRTGLVPNRLTYPAIVAGLVFWPVAGGLIGGGDAAWAMGGEAWIGMLAGLLPFAALVLIGGLGGGDMKLMAAVGALSASWEVVLSTTMYALLVATAMAVVVMIRQGVVRQTLGRVLAAAVLASHRVKPKMDHDSPTVPFAAAVAAGAMVAGAEQLLGLQTPWRAFIP